MAVRFVVGSAATTTSPAAELVEKLEGAFGRAQVAAVQAEIGIDHRDQGEVGKVMALRRHLGAD